LIPCRNQMAPNKTKRPPAIFNAIFILLPRAPNLVISEPGTLRLDATDTARPNVSLRKHLAYPTPDSAAVSLVRNPAHPAAAEALHDVCPFSNPHSITSGYADRQQEQLLTPDPDRLEAFLRRSCQLSGDAASRPSYQRNTSGLRR
jgi:hypothetical protein